MKSRILNKFALFICTTFLALTVNAQQTPQQYVEVTDYLMYLPEGYNADTTAQWPLMLFLHGAGEVGTDLQNVAKHGPAKLINEGKKFPFIVISPQTETYGWKPEKLYGLLQDVMKNYRVDKDRVYLTGLSMGGFGTWETAEAYPDMFAAIIPICGGGDPEKAYKLQHVPVWCFSKEIDPTVNISHSQKMIDALKPYNQDVTFTIYPGEGHDSWTETYANNEIYKWLLSKKRFKYEEKNIDASLLKEYAGKYRTEDGIDLEFTVEGNGLQAWMKGEKNAYLKPFSDSVFFYRPDIFWQVEFVRGTDGRVSHFKLTDNQVDMQFKKQQTY